MNPDPDTNPAPETPTPRLEPFPVPPPPIEFKLSDRIADLERALTDAKRENERLTQKVGDLKGAVIEALGGKRGEMSWADALHEVERLKAERQWQPIETAPKGGTHGHGLFLITNNLHARDAFGNMSHAWVVLMVHKTPSGYEAYCNATMQKIHAVTHWAPLPTAIDRASEGQG